MFKSKKKIETKAALDEELTGKKERLKCLQNMIDTLDNFPSTYIDEILNLTEIIAKLRFRINMLEKK